MTASLAIALGTALAGCGPKTGNSDASELSPDISMNSSRTAKQLLTGFYGVEDGAWRWTAKTFSVALGVPAGAAAKGGKLTFRFVFPDPAIKALHTVTLSANVLSPNVKDVALAPQTYSTTGEQVYAQDIPASNLASTSVRVDFSLDKAISPGQVDIRELGVIAKEVSLTSK
jgi:hypothetical protein